MIIERLLIFLVVLILLVVVHEIGHFLAAKISGVWVEEFGFGLPPKVWGKKIGDTLYTINALPLGGFVRLHGEDGGEGLRYPKRAYANKPKLLRAFIVGSGVIFNFLMAVLLFSTVYFFSGIPRQGGEVKILETFVDSPAQMVGIMPGDVVREVDGQVVGSTSQFKELVEAGVGRRTEILVEREEEGESKQINITVVPRESPPGGEGPLGVVISSLVIYYPPLWQRPFIAFKYGVQETYFWLKTTVVGVTGIIRDAFQGKAPEQVTGPVGIFALTSEASRLGILTLLNFVGILSVNLGIINIIPFPALDGGRLLFIAVEAFFGKKVLPKLESVIHTVGMIILLTLILAITYQDITRLISAGSIAAFLEQFVGQ